MKCATILAIDNVNETINEEVERDDLSKMWLSAR